MTVSVILEVLTYKFLKEVQDLLEKPRDAKRVRSVPCTVRSYSGFKLLFMGSRHRAVARCDRPKPAE